MKKKDETYTCADCGSVSWHLRRDMGVECAQCNSELNGVVWGTDIDMRHARLAALREVLAWVSSTGLRVNKQNMEMRLMSFIKREEEGR